MEQFYKRLYYKTFYGTPGSERPRLIVGATDGKLMVGGAVGNPERGVA